MRRRLPCFTRQKLTNENHRDRGKRRRSFRRSLRSESSMVVSNIPCFCPFCLHIWILLKAFSFLLSIFWENITREIAHRYTTNVKNQNNRPSYTSPRFVVTEWRIGIGIGWNGKRGTCLRDFILAGNVTVEIVLSHLDFRFFGDKIYW